MRQDSNPRPSNCESSLLSTRPGFRPLYIIYQIHVITLKLNQMIKSGLSPGDNDVDVVEVKEARVRDGLEGSGLEPATPAVWPSSSSRN